jgi:hypothetical protein
MPLCCPDPTSSCPIHCPAALAHAGHFGSLDPRNPSGGDMTIIAMTQPPIRALQRAAHEERDKAQTIRHAALSQPEDCDVRDIEAAAELAERNADRLTQLTQRHWPEPRSNAA